MSTATQPRKRQSTTDRERLRVSEAVQFLGIAEAEQATEEGTVLLHLMRPCLGKGRGRHVYEAKMLQEHAESGHFDDWPMFVDHEAPEALKARRGLPRSLRDVGGRIVRTWWDPTVQEGDGYGQGAVVAEAKPVPWVHELIEHDPKLANVSLNTFATGVRPTRRGGRSAYIVEGFEHEGSADWVTKAGAGGKVVQLMEAAMENGDFEDAEHPLRLLEAMPEDRLEAWLRETRPAVAEALTTPAPADGEEETDMTLTPEEIQEAALEALRSDDGKAVVLEALQEGASEAVQEALRTVLPDAIGRAAEVIEQNAAKVAEATVRNGDLRRQALAIIEAAKLPEAFEADAKSRIAEATFEDQTDDEGAVTKTAEDVAKEVAEAEVERADTLFEAATGKKRKAPTAVSGNGDGGAEEEGGESVAEADADEEAAHLRHELQEAGVDYRAAYLGARSKADEEREESAAKADEEREAAAAAA